MNWRKGNATTIAMLLTWAATSSSPACALISAVVETLRLSQDKVAVLAGDTCKQGMNEAQAVAHGLSPRAITPALPALPGPGPGPAVLLR